MAQPMVNLQELNRINGGGVKLSSKKWFLPEPSRQPVLNYLQDCVCSGQLLQVKLNRMSGKIRVPNASESKKEEKKND